MFEKELCNNVDHLISKMHKMLLKLNTEEAQVKECMVKWAQIFGYNVQMEQWEDMWKYRLKFLRSYNLKENFYFGSKFTQQCKKY